MRQQLVDSAGGVRWQATQHTAQVGVRIEPVELGLIHSAKLNGLDPYAYLRDVLAQLPVLPVSRIDEVLPHHWRAPRSLSMSRCNQRLSTPQPAT